MFNWMEVRKKIASKDLKSKTWLSDQKNLLLIFSWAEAEGIPPTDAGAASISNLRTIIRAAKKSKSSNDTVALSRLFKYAAELSTGELRLKIGKRQREIVVYKMSKTPVAIYIQLNLTQEQFHRVQESTKQYFLFKNFD